MSQRNAVLGFIKPTRSTLNLCRTAIHEQLHAIHKAGIARGQEQSYRRNLLRTPDFAARDLRLKEFLSIWPQWIQNRRIDRSRAQNIHPYLSVLEVHQPSSCKRSHRGFTCGIDSKSRESLDARNRSVQEDRTAIGKERQCFLHRKQGATHIQIKGRVEMLLGDVADLGEFAPSRASEQNVNFSFLLLDRFVQPV